MGKNLTRNIDLIQIRLHNIISKKNKNISRKNLQDKYYSKELEISKIRSK